MIVILILIYVGIYICLQFSKINKCSARSMEVKLPTLKGNYDGNYDRQSIQPTNRLIDGVAGNYISKKDPST